jgi:hypothetical protein
MDKVQKPSNSEYHATRFIRICLLVQTLLGETRTDVKPLTVYWLRSRPLAEEKARIHVVEKRCGKL